MRVELKADAVEAKRKKGLSGFKWPGLIASGSKPQWLLSRVIPVIPPEAAQMVPLDGGRFATRT